MSVRDELVTAIGEMDEAAQTLARGYQRFVAAHAEAAKTLYARGEYAELGRSVSLDMLHLELAQRLTALGANPFLGDRRLAGASRAARFGIQSDAVEDLVERWTGRIDRLGL